MSLDSFVLEEVSAGDIEPSLNPSYYGKSHGQEHAFMKKQHSDNLLRERPNPFTQSKRAKRQQRRK